MKSGGSFHIPFSLFKIQSRVLESIHTQCTKIPRLIFRELFTCEIFLLWRQLAWISAHKFHDKMSIKPERYLCKPDRQCESLPGVIHRQEGMRITGSESDWAFMRPSEALCHCLTYYVPAIHLYSEWSLHACLTRLSTQESAAWLCTSLSSLSSNPTTRHIVIFS